ncbi:MAG: DUF6516 family protein [Methanotrichaceae archaeon]
MVVKEAIDLPDYEKFIAIAYLTNGYTLHIRERYSGGDLIKYSYRLIKDDDVVRWDNVPHHKEICIYPHHKHKNDQVLEFSEMDIIEVLRAIEAE